MTRRFLTLLLLGALAAACCWGTAAPPAREGPSGERQAEGETGLQVAFKVINFVILFGLLGYLLRKPAGEFFAGRTRAIQQNLAEARSAREQAEKRLAEIEQRLARLGEEVGALRAQAEREAADQRDRLRAAAAKEAEKILATAESEIDGLARTARLELKSYTAQLAVELAEERIRAEMKPETQERIVRAYVEDLNQHAGEK